MKITIKPSKDWAEVSGVECRIWNGVAEDGSLCRLFVPLIVVEHEHAKPMFMAELAGLMTKAQLASHLDGEAAGLAPYEGETGGELTADYARHWLECYAASPAVVGRVPGPQRLIDRAAIACLDRREYFLGMAVAILSGLRVVGLHGEVLQFMFELWRERRDEILIPDQGPPEN